MDTLLIRDRNDVILRHVQAGRVLDVGCVDSRPARNSAGQRIAAPNHLFKQIVSINPDTTGVDIDPAGIEALKLAGYKAVCANVETMDLQQRFDVITAGEIIEHLENPGQFLRNLRRHLSPTGVVILTTPNPFYQGFTWKIWRYGKPCIHEDHVGWQDLTTMTALLKRTGYKVVESYFVQPNRSILRGWKTSFRRAFAKTLLMVARPATAAVTDSPEQSPAASSEAR